MKELSLVSDMNIKLKAGTYNKDVCVTSSQGTLNFVGTNTYTLLDSQTDFLLTSLVSNQGDK